VNVAIVGGGPGGLYLALLLRRGDPSRRVRVFEQNPEGATYGWGLVFSERALAFMHDSDPASFADLERHLALRPEQHVIHRGRAIVLRGTRFSAVARLELLRILHHHCRAAGVELEFERRIASPDELAGWDLIVAADGANSALRSALAAELGATIALRANRYVWYGTPKPIDALSLTFRENADGVWVAHAYRYAPDRSTFIIECDTQTFARSGLRAMSDEQARAYCERVFATELDGQPLLSNRSLWNPFAMVRTERWSSGNVVLMGDALRTAHFSIGSGTRKALEDAVALAAALAAEPKDLTASFARFRAERGPTLQRLVDISMTSAAWYERVREHMRLDPVPFTYSFVTRAGHIDLERLRERDAEFAASYEEFERSSANSER